MGSPIYSHFSETQSGVNIIKAYSKESQFTEMMQTNIDNHTKIDIAICYMNFWLGVRLQILASLITTFAALVAIYARTTLSAGLACNTNSYF